MKGILPWSVPFYEERALSSISCPHSWLHPRARATSLRWESESSVRSCSWLQNNKRSIILIAVACQLLWGLAQEVASYIVTQFIFICWKRAHVRGLRRVLWRQACARCICTLGVLHRIAFIGFLWWDLKRKKNSSSTDTERLLFTLWLLQKMSWKVFGVNVTDFFTCLTNPRRESHELSPSSSPCSRRVWRCRMFHPDVVFDSDMYIRFLGQWHEAGSGRWPLSIWRLLQAVD